MATPSARDMLMQVQRYANGGTASAGSSVGLARALANGTSQEQYYQNIREYVAKNPNPLAALNAASENGVSTADINSALGTKAASDYFTIDYNTEAAPSTNVATGFTSALAQRYNAPGGPGQSALDARIREVSQQYAAKTPENAQILRDLFIKEGASIADVQRAGVDPSVLLGAITFPALPVIPAYTPPVVTPETQTQFPQPTKYTAPTVYQPLPAPPPIYATDKPALDVNFRDSAPRSESGSHGYIYSPAAKLLAATGAGMSWTPPSVTSRPRELLKVPLPTAANPQYSASQQFARDSVARNKAAQDLAALSGGRFSKMQAPEPPPVDPNAPVDSNAVKATELRFYAPPPLTGAKGGEIKKSEGSAQEELARFAKGGIIDKAIQMGAEALGFDNERQIAISKEAADLTNQMVDAGLIEDQYRVQLSIPEDVTKRTRLNTGIKGDEEVFNAVNHALFAYDAGQSTLGKVGAQAKELYQGLVKKMGGGDPRSEYLDYFNNKFGFNLAEQGLSREEAKRAIINNVGNLDEQGTRGRLFRGEEIKGGTDLLTNVQDAKYPWEKPLGYEKGGPVSRPMTNAELLAQMDRIGATPNAKTPDPAPTREQTESRNMLDRLAAASAVDQDVYKTTGMEPGLDRAAILPFAGTREQGNLQFAAPQMLYDLAKAAVAPGVAASGRQVSNEDALNTALNITGGSFGASSIAGPVGENILGMAVKPRGGVFRPTVTEDTVRAPSGIDTLVDSYRQLLVREGTVPTEQIDDIVAKARRYFTTAYGTAEDPLRLAILEGTLNPTFSASGFSVGRPRFRDYLLEAARRDYTTEQGVAAQVDAGKLAAEAPLRTSQSLEDFERLYDEGTGLQGTVYREKGDITPDRFDVASAVRGQLEGEGVPEERVNPNIKSRSPTDGLHDAVAYPNSYGIDAPFYRTLIAGTDPTLKMAMEKGDPVYDIGGTDLDFLSPSNIATGIGGLPLTSLSGMTFPQMAVKGAKIAALRGDFNAVVDRARAGKPIPKTFLLENGVKKITDAGDSTWFRITDSMYTKLEGAMMGHSVGGYSGTDPYGLGRKEGGGKAAFDSGLAQVYSLRNSQTGKPSITVEMSGIGDGPLRITEIYGYKNGVPSPDEWDSVFKLAKEQRVDPSDMLEKGGYGRDSNGERLPSLFPVPWRQLYNGYLRAADEAPTKKAKGGSVERVYNDRKYI